MCTARRGRCSHCKVHFFVLTFDRRGWDGFTRKWSQDSRSTKLTAKTSHCQEKPQWSLLVTVFDNSTVKWRLWHVFAKETFCLPILVWWFPILQQVPHLVIFVVQATPCLAATFNLHQIAIFSLLVELATNFIDDFFLVSWSNCHHGSGWTNLTFQFQTEKQMNFNYA